MAILSSIGTFLVQTVLRIFLSGLFNTVLQQIQDNAAHAVATAQLQVQTTNDAAAVAIQMAQDQANVKVQAAQQKPDPADPFHADTWN